MRAVTIAGGALIVREPPDPVAQRSEVLIAVRASGLNNADLAQIRGNYPAPAGSPSDIPGLELAGEIVAIGGDVARFAVGDRVMALVGGGAHAEMIAVQERLVMPVPAGMTWEQAGGFPEAFVTAHDALFSQCRLTLGERVLVHGAAGGVGSAAVQLAIAAGASVVATVRSEHSRPLVAAFGAEAVAPDDFVDRGPYDVVVELVSVSNMANNIRSLNSKGRISVVGGSDTKFELDIRRLMMKRGSIHAASLRSRPLEDKATAVRLVELQALPLAGTGRLTVPVAAAFPIDQAQDAYDMFARPGKFGKIVLTYEA